jgi:hypothetical protein
MIHFIYSTKNILLNLLRIGFLSQVIVRSMSRRKAYIELRDIPTLKEAYEEEHFSQRNLKRAAKCKEIQLY